MSLIRANWTDLTGRVVSARTSPDRNEFVEIEVDVQKAESVEGFADFLSNRTGRKIVINCRRSALQNEKIAAGSLIRVRARRGRRPDQVFAHTQHIHVDL